MVQDPLSTIQTERVYSVYIHMLNACYDTTAIHVWVHICNLSDALLRRYMYKMLYIVTCKYYTVRTCIYMHIVIHRALQRELYFRGIIQSLITPMLDANVHVYVRRRHLCTTNSIYVHIPMYMIVCVAEYPHMLYAYMYKEHTNAHTCMCMPMHIMNCVHVYTCTYNTVMQYLPPPSDRSQ